MNDVLRLQNILRRKRGTTWYIKPRTPDYHTLSLVTLGTLDYWADGNVLRIGPGEAILIPAGLEKRAANRSGLEASSYSVLFYGPLPQQFDQRRGHRICCIPIEELVCTVNALHKHWLTGNTQCCRGYLEVILGLLATPASVNGRPTDPRVDRMHRYVLNHFEERIRLHTLAAIAGLSRGYAGTLFHRQFGITVQNYANSLRVRHAQALLCESWDTLECIASQCGFDDSFYFSKVFKKHTGLSPAAYRKQFG